MRNVHRNFSTARCVAVIATGPEKNNQLTRFRREKFQGLKGLAHARFGGPGEDNPRSRKHAALRPYSFRLTPRQHFRPSTAKRKVFLPQANPGRPEPVPDVIGKEKRSDMSVSKVSKGLLLGLALLLATSVFAANKGTLQVSDSVTVNGKQLRRRRLHREMGRRWTERRTEYHARQECGCHRSRPHGRSCELSGPGLGRHRRQQRRAQVAERNPLLGEEVCFRDWRRICEIQAAESTEPTLVVS